MIQRCLIDKATIRELNIGHRTAKALIKRITDGELYDTPIVTQSCQLGNGMRWSSIIRSILFETLSRLMPICGES